MLLKALILVLFFNGLAMAGTHIMQNDPAHLSSATVDGQAFFATSSGKVGIGTSNPGVTVETDASAPTRGIVGKFVNTSANSTGSFFSLAASGANVWSFGLPGSGSPDFAFFSARDETTDGNERMRITTAGGFSVASFIQLTSQSLSQLQALTTSAGQAYYCSDCTTDAVCVATGTANSFVRLTARTTPCQ